MRTAAGRENWVAVMVTAIRDTVCANFPHDFGDMFSAAYAECWLEVCRRLPEVRFWILTRAWQVPNGPLPVYNCNPPRWIPSPRASFVRLSLLGVE
jgi:hypothetical protein